MVGEPGMETLLLVLDLIGTFVFALSGATAGSQAGSICSGFWSCRMRRATPEALPATC